MQLDDNVPGGQVQPTKHQYDGDGTENTETKKIVVNNCVEIDFINEIMAIFQKQIQWLL